MTSKEYILDAITRAGVEPAPMSDLGALEAAAIRYDDALGAFCEAVAKAGGRVVDSMVEPTADSFVVRGSFAVAENGCVWIQDWAFERRKDLFIHEDLIIILDRKEIVDNMHVAYARIGEGRVNYGIFISGPSKTADIEQALVLGAHGPRSLVVVLE